MFNNQIIIKMESKRENQKIKKEKVFSFQMFVVILCIAMMSCQKENNESGGVSVTGVTLNKTTLTLEVGSKETLEATVIPSEADNKATLWSSDKPSIADVNDKGEVTGKAVGGPVIITVTTKNGNKKAACEVMVIETGSGLTVNWTKVAETTFGNSPISGIAKGNNKYVIVGGSNKLAYSDGDINQWNAVNIGGLVESFSINSIAYGNGTFVILGYNGTAAYTREDDITNWTKSYHDGQNQPFYESQVFNPGIAFGNNRFIAHRNGNVKFSDDNGVTWKPAIWTGNGNSPFTNIQEISWNGSRFVAVGGLGNWPITGKIACSNDGETWTEVTEHPFDSGIFGIVWDGDKFIAVAAWEVAHSKDGLDWSLYYKDSFDNPSGSKIAFGGGIYIVTGAYDDFSYSNDTKTWLKEKNNLFIDGTMTGIIYDGKKFVAVGGGDNSIIAYSNNIE